MNPLEDPTVFEEGKQYSIRPTERANRDVEAELERLSQWNGSEQDPKPTKRPAPLLLTSPSGVLACLSRDTSEAR